MLVSMFITVVLTSIAIGSNVAYANLLSLNFSGLLTSYIICTSCILVLQLHRSELMLTISRHTTQTTLRRSHATFAVQTWQVRPIGEHYRFSLPLDLLVLPILPSDTGPDARRNELELCAVVGHSYLHDDLLCITGTACLRRSNSAYKEG